MVFNHHKGHRGDHLVPLGNAGNLATGFADPKSIEVIQRYFVRDDLQKLKSQFYPIVSNTISVNSVTTMSKLDALEMDANAPTFLAQSRPVLIDNSYGRTVGYQVPIPAQSDF